MPNYCKIYNVICEGKSEVAYFNELSKLLREENILQPIRFVPKVVGTGHYTNVYQKFKEEYKKNSKTSNIIFVDWDIYQRNERKNLENYNKKSIKVPDFFFNHKNFEDFLALHLEEDLLNKWIDICFLNNHFEQPMVESVYLPLFKKHIFPNYDKGDFPFESFTINMLKQAIENNDKNLPIHSDFLSEIKNILQL